MSFHDFHALSTLVYNTIILSDQFLRIFQLGFYVSYYSGIGALRVAKEWI